MPSGSLAALLPHADTSLLEIIDRLLNQGVVLTGEATISVAGVDLIFLGLNLVLASVQTIVDHQPGRGSGVGGRDGSSPAFEDNPGGLGHEGGEARTSPAGPRPPTPGPRIDIDPDSVEQGLMKLVLTIVELLRQLLERQAVRRMEGGSLTDEEVERVGLALSRLEEKVRELAAQFGLQPRDLNIDLGPLGAVL